MRGKEDLFYLIKSLSRSEKRYFTLDAQKSGRDDSRYLELFQAINQQEEYDEESLKDRFGKGLRDDKGRLYEAILRSMRDYRSAKSYAARIKELLLDAHFLYERDLYEQAEARLLNAKEIAIQLGDHLSLLEINKEQRKIWKDRRAKGFELRLGEFTEEKNTSTEALMREFALLDLHDAILTEVVKNPQQLPDAQKPAVQARYRDLLNAEAVPPSSIQGKLRFFQSLALVYQLLGDSNEVYRCSLEVIRHWNENPRLKEEEFDLYIKNYSNLLHAAFNNADRFAEIPALLAQLEREDPDNLHSKKVLFQKLSTYKLVYYLNSDHRENLDDILKPIAEGLKNYDLSPANELAIRFNAALLAFLAADYRRCDEWIDKIIAASKKTSLRQDIQDSARIIRLITAFHEDAIETTDNALRSAYRYFARRPPDAPLAALGKLMLSELRKYLFATPDEEAACLRDMRQAIETLRAQIGRIPLGLDELIFRWIQTRS